MLEFPYFAKCGTYVGLKFRLRPVNWNKYALGTLIDLFLERTVAPNPRHLQCSFPYSVYTAGAAI